jgi:hypothetical protein
LLLVTNIYKAAAGRWDLGGRLHCESPLPLVRADLLLLLLLCSLMQHRCIETEAAARMLRIQHMLWQCCMVRLLLLLLLLVYILLQLLLVLLLHSCLLLLYVIVQLLLLLRQLLQLHRLLLLLR